MHIQSIKLNNYKNYEHANVRFSNTVNAVLGNNGMGKTNLLDAIYYVCLGKSYFSSQDRYVLKKGGDFVRVEALLDVLEEKEKFEMKLIPAKLKEIKINGDKIGKLSEHIGRYPCIVIAPIDVQMMLDGSEERRKFINNTIIQYDKPYIQALLSYNRLLKQRNALLKQMAENRTFNPDLLETYSTPMLEPAQYIYKMRAEFCEKVTASFEKYYQQISGGQEESRIIYTSHLQKGDYQEAVKAAQEKDRILGRSTVGIHKDDIVFKMDDQALKYFGSQGQLKSFVLSLKLAQYDILRNVSGKEPILLLDDIFDKLDQHRVKQLLDLVTGDGFGQIFISDTSLTLVPGILNESGIDFSTFVAHEGTISTSSELQ